MQSSSSMTFQSFQSPQESRPVSALRPLFLWSIEVKCPRLLSHLALRIRLVRSFRKLKKSPISNQKRLLNNWNLPINPLPSHGKSRVWRIFDPVDSEMFEMVEKIECWTFPVNSSTSHSPSNWSPPSVSLSNAAAMPSTLSISVRFFGSQEKSQNSRTENDLLNFRISLTLGQLFYRVGHFALFQAQSKNTSPVHLYFYLCKRRGRLKVNGATKYGHCVFE